MDDAFWQIVTGGLNGLRRQLDHAEQHRGEM